MQDDQYAAINTADTTTKGYYVIKSLSEDYTLQEEKTFNRKMRTAGELVVKEKYINCIQHNKKCYWGKSQQQNNIIFPTHKSVHIIMDVTEVTETR